MSKVQQLLTMDEIEAGNIEEMWLDAVAAKLDLKGKPGSEVTQDRLQDTNVTTLWYKNQPVAVAVRQRNDWNWTALTMAEIEPMKAELYPSGPSEKRSEIVPAPSLEMKDWIIATANDPSVLRAFDQALITRGSVVTRDQRAMIVFDLCRAIAARGIPSEPQKAARTELIQSEAKQRCIAAGYSLDRLATEDRNFRHDDLRPWWEAKFVPAIAREIEKVEKAGFTVAPAATDPSTVDEKAVVSIKPMALSGGRMDYYVSIKVGDREVTPHAFQEEYKAAYHVALYDWLLNGSGEEPDCVDFGPDDWPARSGPPVGEISHGGRERCLEIQRAWTHEPTCEWPECGCHKPAEIASPGEGLPQSSGIMVAAEKASQRMAGWSASKKEYADRIVGTRAESKAHPSSADVAAEPACGLQELSEIRDFLRDIAAGGEVSERSRDVATGFVSIMDVQFGRSWRDGTVSGPLSSPEAIAAWLAAEYPDNVSTNAFCAAIRSLGHHSQSGCANHEDVRECLISADRIYGGNRLQLPFVNHLAVALLQKFRMSAQ